MTSTDAISDPNLRWLEANQRHLSAALARIRLALQASASIPPGASKAERPTVPPYEPGPEVGGARPALDRLVSLFGLSPFERDLILLVAGAELDSSIAASCAAAQRDAQR